MPSAAALLAEIDPLPYPERTRLLAERARDLARSGGLASLLDELLRGDGFQRRTAMFMAVVGGSREVVAAAIHDPDWEVQRPALGAWVRSASAADVTAFVLDASYDARRHVYRTLRRRPDTGTADELVDAVWERFGDSEAARLLPACSASTLAALLPELGYAVSSWGVLGQRHPEVVLSVAGSQLAELGPADRVYWWGRGQAGVLAAARSHPLPVLDLLERYAPPGSLPGDPHQYIYLARADSGRLLTWLTAPDRAGWLARTRLPRTLLRHLAAVDLGELAPLAQRPRDDDRGLASLLAAVPPSRRPAVYDLAYAGTDQSQARPGDRLLDLLPHGRREAEARRVLSLGLVRDDPDLVLHYTAFLPWEQAKPALIAATTRASAEDRAVGYELLVACAARSATVGEAIEYLRRIRNEQDPVRSRVLAALAQVSPHLLAPDAAAALGQIGDDVLAARDASSQTRQALGSLAVAVLRQCTGPSPLLTWSLRMLTGLSADSLPPLGRIDTRLRRGQEAELFAAVQERLRSGMDRGSYASLFALTRALHRRAWKMPQLQDMLREAISTRNVTSVMREGIVLWLADPARRAHRVEYVLRADSSAVTLLEVWGVLSGTRTDLLDEVLVRVPRGRFVAAGVRWIPAQAPGVHRWLPRQQKAYAGLLDSLAADGRAKMYMRTGAITTAAAIPDAGWTVAERYIDSADTRLAEAALAGLASAGHPAQALPILLAHASDDRARVAVYAAGQAARRIPPAQLEPVLATALADSKVTSQKEILRLAAKMSVPGASGMLSRAWAEPGQHRDVRAAVVSICRLRLHDPASWPILTEAAAGSLAEGLAIVAMADPFTCAPRFRASYGRLVARACQSDDQQLARAAWRVIPRWAAWTPALADLVVARLTDLSDRIVWRAVVPALVALLYGGRAGPVLRDAVARLAELDLTPDETGRDRPARQRLTTLIADTVWWADSAGTQADRAPLLEAGRYLGEQPGFVPLAATLLLGAVLLDAPALALAGQLTEIADLVADQPVTAGQLADSLVQRVTAEVHIDPETLMAAITRLEADGRLPSGLLAVALAQYGAQLGWPAAWRAQIRRLRTHSAPDVRTAALAVILAPE